MGIWLEKDVYVFICSLPIALPRLWYYILRDKHRDRKERTFPKVNQRKRSLSLPRKHDIASPPLRGRTVGQAHSLFFKLPAELRISIYKEVVGKSIHIVLVQAHEKQWEIQSYRCPEPHMLAINDNRSSCALRNGLSLLGVMGLLQSCRGVYVSSTRSEY